jgi:hypothetical protein
MSSIYKKIKRISYWTLAITALLSAMGWALHGHDFRLSSSATSEKAIYLNFLGIGGYSVWDPSGKAIPLRQSGAMNKNINFKSWRTLSSRGGPLGHYAVTEYDVTGGNTATVSNWRITYIPQTVLALILPVASLIGRTRRVWPMIGIWEHEGSGSRAGRRIVNWCAGVSLFIGFSTLILWAIAAGLPGALPSIHAGFEREISFLKGGVNYRSVVIGNSGFTNFVNISHHGDGPVYTVQTIWKLPYWCIILPALVFPIVRGGFAVLHHRKRARRAVLGRCPSCGYDLRMSEDRCPECGLAFTRRTIVIENAEAHRESGRELRGTSAPKNSI